MSDEKRSESGAATATIVLIVLLLGLIGLTIIGGGGALFVIKATASQREAEMLEAQARAEMVAAQMQAQAGTAAPKTVAATPELLLEIDATGDYKLAGKAMEYYDDLKAALLTAHFEQGENLQIVISADKETRFDQVAKAVEAAECAGITKHRILTSTSQPPARSAITSDPASLP